MAKPEYIKIYKPKIKNNTLKFDLTYSQNIKKYFRTDHFTVSYDEYIRDVDPGILHVPVVANTAPMAWLTGADIYVDQLDKTFIQSLNEIETVFRRWYTHMPFSTEISVDEVSSNRFGGEGYGLFFSGGLDSTTSYLRHRDKRPNLFTVWGADVPLDEPEFWGRIEGRFREFAAGEGVGINFIRSNLRAFLNEGLVNRHYRKELLGYSYWGMLQHGLGLIGLSAPLTEANKIGSLFIASTASADSPYANGPWGSHPSVDNKISWADVRVIHDGFEYNRQDKIRRVVKKYIEETSIYPQFRKCYSQRGSLNCNRCPGCVNLIIRLIAEDIDPRRCGFEVDRGFFDYVKKKILAGEYMTSEGGVISWKIIQEHARENDVSFDLYGVREFLEWFRGYEFSKGKKGFMSFFRRELSKILSLLPKKVRENIYRTRGYLGACTSEVARSYYTGMRNHRHENSH